ncbi:MAG TPA: hypothetical protein VGG13_02610 [Candidatus Saccharimonadales bacterium]|jgi:hypothetical protein
MVQKDESIEEIIDRELGVLIEHMDDQFAIVLEAVDMSTSKIPAMGERLEKVEHDITSIKLTTMNNPHDLRLIKIRTEKLDDISAQVHGHEVRLTKPEQAA